MIASGEDAFLFSLSDLTWRSGPPLPQNLHTFTSVQLDNGFMAIGGKDGEGLATSTVFTIDSNYNWATFEDTLDTKKVHSMGVNVPSSFLDC